MTGLIRRHPIAAALIVTRITDGPGGLTRLFRRFVRWRVGWFWWLLATVIIAVAAAVGYLFWPVAVGWDPYGVPVIVQVVVMAVLYIVGGPLQEEPGWRGVALPRMQQYLHPAVVALIIGVLWCCWHAPLFFTREWDTPRNNAADIAAYLLMVVALSFVLSWLTNGAHDSILLAIIGHNTVNWTLAVTPLLFGREVISVWPAALGFSVLAIVGLVVTRGRLGLNAPAAAR